MKRKSSFRIPIAEPLLSGNEESYVRECVRGNWISSKGRYVKEFEERFSSYCGVKHGVALSSGTAALHVALKALEIGGGDEVILPSFSMAAAAFAVLYTGATPVPVDAERATWNIDPGEIERKITGRTKAIVAVHTYGHPADMDAIREIAEEHGIYVVEDAAEAHGAEYKGRMAGSLGDVACFSFYGNKIITTGEGGMLVTDDDGIAERARLLRNMAFIEKRRFLHPTVGFNYRLTNLQAAIGLAQLERIDELVEIRRRNARLYNTLLRGLEGISLPPEGKDVKNVYWMYSILIDDGFGMTRDGLMERLSRQGIETRPFFIPIHRQPFMGAVKGRYPVSDELSEKGINLPSGATLTEEKIRQVVQAVEEAHDS